MTMKNPPHPGLSVRHDCIEPLDLSITETADILGVTRQTFNNPVNGKRGVTPEGFPRGWSNASIINSARTIRGGPATLCERCKTEIALANALDAELDVNRRRRELLAGGERRVLPPATWALFEALYAGRGHPLSGHFLRKAI